MEGTTLFFRIWIEMFFGGPPKLKPWTQARSKIEAVDLAMVQIQVYTCSKVAATTVQNSRSYMLYNLLNIHGSRPYGDSPPRSSVFQVTMCVCDQTGGITSILMLHQLK